MKQNRVYRVIQPVNHSTKNISLKENELTAIIADALMSELDKDELINKKMIREL